MRKAKALAAIVAAIFLGTVAATLLTGCQPKKPKGPKVGTTSTTTDAAPSITIPNDEPKADKPVEATETKPVVPPGETPTDANPSGSKPADEKPAAVAPPEAKPEAAEPKPDAEKQASSSPPTISSPQANPEVKPGAWNQWGGTSLRNNTPEGKDILIEWAPGDFDRKTGAWKPETATNIKWVATLGSQTYGNTVVASGKVWLGTNNSNGYIKRYPGDIDLGALVCFDEATGKFLWQHSSEKLPTGRVHDWPLQGICCSPLVEGDRLWFVTSRGEVRCLDVDGFYDGKDDGRPEKAEPARLFDVRRADDPAEDKVNGYVAELDAGKIPADVRERFAATGMPLPESVELKADDKAKAPSKRWNFQADVNGSKRDLYIQLVGPNLSAFKIITPDDKEESDVIWVVDMMNQFGTSQHNMCSCSVTSWGDILYVNTSNGVDEAHITIPAPDAPSFMAMNKNTGEIYWTDNSPGKNILHGQWSSPTVAIIDGVAQVIFGGGDGWVYSFKAGTTEKELLWKFDINEKDSILELGGRGTRNDIISTPVVYDNKVYFCTGQDPEHGEGDGTLWCIDPKKRGDISEKLAVNRADPKQPIPVKRIQAVVEADGDMAIDNPNSGVIWKYIGHDANGDGMIKGFEEKFHRSISTVAIKHDLLFVPDFSGQFYCVDAQSGKAYWTYDMLAAAWGSSLIVDGHVYCGDEDGDIVVFEVKKEQHAPVAEINMNNSVYSTPVVANNVLYIANKDHIFAIAPAGAEAPKAGGE